MIRSEPRVLIIGQPDFLSPEAERELARQGTVILGPHRADRAISLLQSSLKVDGAIIELDMEEEAFSRAVDALEKQGMPFLFAVSCRPQAEEGARPYGGYVLGEGEAEIAAILEALSREAE